MRIRRSIGGLRLSVFAGYSALLLLMMECLTSFTDYDSNGRRGSDEADCVFDSLCIPF
jgi:hypothetical protein